MNHEIAKNEAELHEALGTLTGHVIDLRNHLQDVLRPSLPTSADSNDKNPLQVEAPLSTRLRAMNDMVANVTGIVIDIKDRLALQAPDASGNYSTAAGSTVF